jgi:hypothetical protein
MRLPQRGFVQVALSEAPVHSNSEDAFPLMSASDTALRLIDTYPTGESNHEQY